MTEQNPFTHTMSPDSPLATHAAHAQAIREQVRKAVVGQEEVIDQVLVALFAAGHVLIEGLPGLGKTLLVRALAKTFSGKSTRIQFTPDLMPSDVVGHVMYDMRSGEFITRRGPVFTNILLADEINRAPAKTQAAMLEVMQERQVTLEGTTMSLPPPFMTLATQNPIEQEGTYPLPDAQMDRFLLKIRIAYPTEQDELLMVNQITRGLIGDDLNTQEVATVVDADTVVQMQSAAAHIHLDDRISQYAVRLVRSTRSWPGLSLGAGPRGGLALVRAGRAYALLQGREFMTPDDIKTVALPALRHRVTLSPETELEGMTTDQLLSNMLESVDAPRI